MPRQDPGPSRFGKWLTDYIREQGTSAAALAACAGLSGNTLFRIMREPNRKPSYDTLVRLSLATGVSQAVLLELAELPAPGAEATINPLRPRLLAIFDALSPSLQRSFVSIGESMLEQTRKANS